MSCALFGSERVLYRLFCLYTAVRDNTLVPTPQLPFSFIPGCAKTSIFEL